MRLSRAAAHSEKYMNDHCRVIDPKNTQDIYGGEADPQEGRVLYDGRCFTSPGNMWPFETGGDVIRQGRTDLQIYVPRDVEGINSDCIVEYDDKTYEVIGLPSRTTAGATINITARRVR